MRLSNTTMKQAARVSAALSVLLVIIAISLFFRDNSKNTPAAGGTGSGQIHDPIGALGGSESPSSASTSGPNNPFDKSDPFANTFSSSTQVYKVEFRASSDGPIRQLAYRIRDVKSGKAQLVKVTPRTWSMTRSIQGPRYVAEMAVQVYPTASYVTCTLYIDGVKISSKTAKGNYHVAVCLA